MMVRACRSNLRHILCAGKSAVNKFIDRILLKNFLKLSINSVFASLFFVFQLLKEKKNQGEHLLFVNTIFLKKMS